MRIRLTRPRAGSEFKDGLRCRFLARRESVAIKFEKEYADNKTRTLIAIDERVIPDDACCVFYRELDNIGALVVEMVLRSPKRGVE